MHFGYREAPQNASCHRPTPRLGAGSVASRDLIDHGLPSAQPFDISRDHICDAAERIFCDTSYMRRNDHIRGLEEWVSHRGRLA